MKPPPQSIAEGNLPTPMSLHSTQPSALARAFVSLAKPPDCYARRAVEDNGGLNHNIPGANLLAFDACLRVSACCMPVMEACFPGGKQSKGELVVVLAACMMDNRAWVMRERPSPAPRL